MIDAAINNLICANTDIGNRVYPSTETVVVTSDLPKVVYTRINTERQYSDSGASSLVKAHYQVDIFADAMSQARTVADAIRAAMDGYSGTIESTPIVRIYFNSDHFELGERAEGANKTVARFVLDMLVDYRE